MLLYYKLAKPHICVNMKKRNRKAFFLQFSLTQTSTMSRKLQTFFLLDPCCNVWCVTVIRSNILCAKLIIFTENRCSNVNVRQLVYFRNDQEDLPACKRNKLQNSARKIIKYFWITLNYIWENIIFLRKIIEQLFFVGVNLKSIEVGLILPGPYNHPLNLLLCLRKRYQ